MYRLVRLERGTNLSNISKLSPNKWSSELNSYEYINNDDNVFIFKVLYDNIDHLFMFKLTTLFLLFNYGTIHVWSFYVNVIITIIMC